MKHRTHISNLSKQVAVAAFIHSALTLAVHAATHQVPSGMHPTIQAAIDSPAVAPGDTIEVIPGTYTENLTVSKTLFIQSETGTFDLNPVDTLKSVIHVLPGENLYLYDAHIDGGDPVGTTNGPSYGGGIRAEGNLIATRCEIFQCSATNGGAVSSEGDFSYLVECGVFENTASSKGGGVYVGTDCRQYLYGGGGINEIFLNDGRLGGGIYAGTDSELLFFDPNFVSENTSVYGGGIRSVRALLIDIRHSEISFNFAVQHGGGIRSSTTDEIRVRDDSEIRGNGVDETGTLTRYGGGVYAYGSGKLIVTDTTNDFTRIHLNEAEKAGGGVRLRGGAELVLNASGAPTITGNLCDTTNGGGGANATLGGILPTDVSTISGNTHEDIVQ